MKNLFYLGDTSGALVVTMTVLRYLVGAFFLFLAYKNFSGDEGMVADFERWQFPVWFKLFTGVCQVSASMLLFVTPVSGYGGLLICGMMLGATYAHLRYDPLITASSPIVFLVLGTAIAYVFRPTIVDQILNKLYT